MSTNRISSVVAYVLVVSSCHSFAPKWKESRPGIAKAVEQVNEWLVPETGLSGEIWEHRPKAVLTTSSNATLPIAMMVLDPALFPSRSMAMRAIRKKEIVVQRAQEDVIEGRADTRVYPSDIIVRRKRQLSGGYQGLTYAKPNVPLPVVYEDDHMAIVNKPSDMICHSHSKGGFNNNSVLRVAPHVLKPPKNGTEGVLEYPALVHRLDAPTSGLLVLSKTIEASVHLSGQFEGRNVFKTYSALLEGVPVHGERIASPIDGKDSVTLWKEIRKVQTTKGVLTMVEFYPQSGRKHQLRKHASEILKCPIVGDELYGSTVGRSLFLCANAIKIKHPYEDLWIEQSIELPKRFEDYITREEQRYVKYQEYMHREDSPSVE